MIVSNLYTRIWLKGIKFANAMAIWNWWYKSIYMLCFYNIFHETYIAEMILLIYKTVKIKHSFQTKK